MLTIGAFAQLGQVTHRMLRHWDSAGILVPAHVDKFSGYRSYDPSQLAQLHRIVALRQLGFGLDDILLFMQQGIDAQRIEQLLRVRREEVEAEHQLAAARLVDVELRLQLIEREQSMSTIEIIEKPLPALRLAVCTQTVAEQALVGPAVGPLFGKIEEALEGHELGMPIAQYLAVEEGLRIVAGYEFDKPAEPGFDILEVPEAPLSICGIHLGPMDQIGASWQEVHDQLLARGYVPDGPCRELYVRSESEDQQDWVTELQQPVRPASAR
ncbi:MerR family transcriptional regulator [Glutamicibacter uratoxydans]|uniref:MerR family transcriptional regulator n=1 Tax=Glutamicibacter uratoxydans TaxID=43667 RepID=A0A4Y4DU89_GLUUR|nr:MerR family transcriptional regulator [Glutamicibacter uratoxydans]GED07444.1 MerR family transcriptional regulator [Glutamicibacter uratoxydans]